MIKLLKLVMLTSLFTVYSHGQYEIQKKEIFNELRSFTNDSLIIKDYLELSNIYRREHKLDSSLFFSEKALESSRKVGIKVFESKSLLAKGQVYYRLFKYEKAFEQLEHALKVAQKSKNKEAITLVLVNTGSLYFQQNKLEKATEFFIQSAKSFQELGQPKRQIISLFNLSLISYQLRQYDKSLEYCVSIEKIKDNKELKNYLNSNIYNQIGSIYNEKGEKLKAIKYYKKTFEYASKIKDDRRVILSQINLGNVYLEIGKINEAHKSFDTAFEKLREIEVDIEELAQAYIGMGKVYLMKNVFLKGIRNTKKGLEIAIKQQQTEFERDAYEVLSKLHMKRNDYQQAFKSLEMYKILSDSLTNIQSIKEVKNLEVKYQTQQKENEILQLSNENIKKDAETRAKSTQLTYALFGGGIVSVLSLITVALYTREKKIKKKVLQQKEEIETLHKELHHRVKNNLGVAKSFIKVAKKNVLEPEGQQALENLQNRFLSMAGVHELLYQQESFSVVDFQLYCEKIVQAVSNTFFEEKKSVVRKISANVKISVTDATPLGLIINEAVTNSYKYAFNEKEKGIITITVKEEEGYIDCIITDDGIGVTEEAIGVNKNSYGMQLIETLVMQLDGTLEITKNKGTNIFIRVPKNS